MATKPTLTTAQVTAAMSAMLDKANETPDAPRGHWPSWTPPANCWPT